MTDVQVGQVDPVTGRARDITVTLTNLSFRQTGAGRQYAYPDFGADFIGALHKALVAPRRRGLFRSTLVCPGCESPLEGIVVQPVPVTTEIALPRIPPIRVDLEMPGIKCPGCGRALVMIDDRAVESDLSDALIDAFAAASLVPR